MAYGSTPESIRQRLGSSIFDEALGVLDMISKTPEQRRYYNARLKWELDENTRRAAEEAARAACHAEGLAEGEARGEARGEAKGVAIGKAQLVRVLQELLGLQESEELELLKLTVAELDAMIVTLRNQFRK